MLPPIRTQAQLCAVILLASLLTICGCDGSSGQTELDAGVDATPGDQVDTFFGAAPDRETRLEIFDTIWNDFERLYAGFGPAPIDWYEVREQYRPAIERAESYGRFFALLSEIFIGLRDGHTVIGSKRVCDTPLTERPPLFVHSDWASTLGACVTALADDNLLVYRVHPDNPAALEPGDIIIGYNGKPWRELLTEIDRWKIPVCGRAAGAARAEDHIRMNSAMNNAHLFKTLEILRLASGKVESISTDGLLSDSSTVLCTEQMAIDGIGFPCNDWDTCLGVGYYGEDNASWGILPGTNIGYIYLYSWLPNLERAFATAVTELFDTDGLIIDQRFNFGGQSSNSYEALSLLLRDSVEDVMNCVRRDETVSDITALEIHPGKWRDLVADPETFYDRPIAVLQGPHAISAGDMVPYYLRYHPRTKHFGMLTNGTFGGSHTYWNPDPIIEDLSVGMSTVICVDSNEEPLQGADIAPDVEVWLEQDDVAAGIDTVVETALAWIQSTS